MCPPLPILLEYGLPALRCRSEFGGPGWEAERPELTRQARLMTTIMVGIPLVLLLYAWLALRRGPVVGAVAGALLAGSPTFLAAAAIATTDACFALFAVLALVALEQDSRRRSIGSYLLLGVAIGLAVGAKQTGVILVAIALGERLARRLPMRRPGWTMVDLGLRRAARVGFGVGGLIAVAFTVNWALYGFRLVRFADARSATTIPEIIPLVVALFPNSAALMDQVRQFGLPVAYDSFIGQMHHAAEGHRAFLMGAHSTHGWWSFFPVALAVKSTPAELALMVLALGLATRPATWRDGARRLWLGTSLVLLGVGMASSINNGQRYMLLVYPLVIALGADWLGALATRRRGWALLAGGVLLAAQAISVGTIAPHYLSYFNRGSGGPLAGYRYLVDSSLDWGQDLPELRRTLEARGYRQVALCYFGTANATTYGLRTVAWEEPNDTVAAATDYLAISATNLQGAYGSSSELYDRFHAFTPIRAGYSIFVYDLRDPRVRAEWDRIRRGPPGPPRTG